MSEKLTKKDLKPLIKSLEEIHQAQIDNIPYNKEILESKLLRLNLELARESLNELPRTKLFARISIILSIGLVILEIIKALGLLN